MLLSCAAVSQAGNVSSQFCGTQVVKIPEGPQFKSQVSVNGKRIRIETTSGGDARAVQVILVHLDEGAVFLLNPSERSATRVDLTDPLPLWHRAIYRLPCSLPLSRRQRH